MKDKLIIFDCDGVLIDSEIIFHQVGSREMTKIGFPLSVEKSIELFSGVADEDMPHAIQKEYGRSIPDNNLSMILEKIRDSFKTDLKPVSGINQVIEHLLQEGINKCIASNAGYGHIINSLAFTDMSKYFSNDLIFNIAMVKKGKPNPDLFIYAANKMQVDPENCVVIEDSLVGVQAAKAAKMPVIGFLGGAHAKNSWYRESIIGADPDLVANDARDLLDILSDKFASRCKK
ncbi:MAG: HAD family phosphatase [Gammaproteobacteria bacterium]|nr:HAD family phosphatase [Gammaproteobacteria bacterium]